MDPEQGEPGSDGIGDIQFIFNENNIDHYPLMGPWVPPDVRAVNLATMNFKNIIGVGFLCYINAVFENQGNKIENFETTVYANETIVASQSFLLRSQDSIIYTFF